MAEAHSLYLDEDVDIQIAERLVALGLSAITTRDLGMLGADDPTQLTIATAHNRIIFTHNRVDFEKLVKEWSLNGTHHCGVLWSPRDYPSYIAGWIAAGLKFYPEFANHIHRVPPPPS